MFHLKQCNKIPRPDRLTFRDAGLFMLIHSHQMIRSKSDTREGEAPASHPGDHWSNADFTSNGAHIELWLFLITVAIAAAAAYISPLKDLTCEIISRTKPNLYDLVIEFIAALVNAIRN